jgi:spermidine synthase
MQAAELEDASYSVTIFTLFAIILLEGFVGISIEILTIRQLIPFVGSSVIVTSLIIGFFLLFLALGYRQGGTYTEHYRAVLLRNFTITCLWQGIGLSYLFIDVFFRFAKGSLTVNPLFNLTLYLLLVTAPLIFILGQTVPITTNLFRREKTIGAISGKVLYLSTIGSFLGAVLTSLILMSFLGVAWTVVINSLFLAILAFLLVPDFLGSFNRVLVLVVGMGLVFVLNVQVERTMFLQTNSYNSYQVKDNFLYDKDVGKAFVVNNSLSSIIMPDQTAAQYINYIRQILFDNLKLRHKRILVLGAGGFTLTANGAHTNDVTYVDIDKNIKAVVKDHFLSKIVGRFIPADARVFIKKVDKPYDAIVLDAYSSQEMIPSYLLTLENMTNIKKALAPKGIAVFNLIMDPTFSTTFSKRLDNTINHVFPHCMKVPLMYMHRPTNVIYLCQKASQPDKMVYKDDKNRSTIDSFFTR